MRDVCDRAGVPHNDGAELIANTGYTVTIADAINFKNVKAYDALNEVMQWLVQKDRMYRLQVTSGNIELVKVSEVNSTADWQLDYRYNMIDMSRGYKSDRLLQRITVIAQDENTDAETQLATVTESTTQTNKDLSWSSKSIYLRIVTSGTGTFTLNYVDSDAKKINYNSTGSITITVFGCVMATGSGIYGEAINQANAEASDGFTQKVTNRLLQTASQAKAMAEALIAEYGDPAYEVTTRIPCNPLLELGDRILIFEKFTNTKTVYSIVSLSHSFSAAGAAAFTTVQLRDLGETFGDIEWDRNGATAGENDLDYDTGRVWDQDLGPRVTEDTTTYPKPVRFT
jgi:hypothetical protein